jgi:NAD(P)-dependent dehydrogenase (short-subunit alcohol dehydrogenase family)
MRNRDTSLQGQVVVVTGASSGIGRATAQELSRLGACVVLAADCQGHGADILTIATDVTDERQVDTLAVAAVDRFGHIDAWVHTAAVVAYGRFEDVPSDVFRHVVDTGVHGTVHASRTALRRFRDQGHGTLVLTGSLLGEIATPYMSSYVTAKWAVRGLSRVLSIETRREPGIEVCVVSPVGVNTPVYLQAANYAGRIARPPPPVDSPEKVAQRIVDTIRSPRPRRAVGPANRLVRIGFTAAPRLFDVMVTPLMRRGGLSRDPIRPTLGNVFEPRPTVDAIHGRWGRRWPALGRCRGCRRG